MKAKNIVLIENKLPESRLIIDGQKEKTDKKLQKKKNHYEIKLEKVNKKEHKSKIKKNLKINFQFKINFISSI